MKYEACKVIKIVDARTDKELGAFEIQSVYETSSTGTDISGRDKAINKLGLTLLPITDKELQMYIHSVKD